MNPVSIEVPAPDGSFFTYEAVQGLVGTELDLSVDDESRGRVIVESAEPVDLLTLQAGCRAARITFEVPDDIFILMQTGPAPSISGSMPRSLDAIINTIKVR